MIPFYVLYIYARTSIYLRVVRYENLILCFTSQKISGNATFPDRWNSTSYTQTPEEECTLIFADRHTLFIDLSFVRIEKAMHSHLSTAMTGSFLQVSVLGKGKSLTLNFSACAVSQRA